MAGPPQVLLGYPPAVQTHHHVHPLQHLHVVVDLKGVVKVEEVLHLVVGNGALDNSLLARVHYDERQLNGGVGGGGPASPLRLLVALHQVFESNLLKDEILELLGFCLDSLYSLRLDNKEGIYLTVSGYIFTGSTGNQGFRAVLFWGGSGSRDVFPRAGSGSRRLNF